MWLKAYYPAYFFANLFNYEDQERYQELIGDMVANGIELLPPSITKSKWEFTVVDNQTVRMGLNTIKGFGDKAYADMLENNIDKVSSFTEFVKIKTRRITKKVIAVLAQAGAFDDFGIPRNAVITVFDLLNDKKIGTWFNRKHGALTIEKMPVCLNVFPEDLVFNALQQTQDSENRVFDFIQVLAPYIKTQTKTELQLDKDFEAVTGFSILYTKKIRSLLEVRKQYPNLPLKTLTERETIDDLCYFLVSGIASRTTKNGKPYKVVTISDQNKTINAYLWDNKITMKKNQGYIANLDHNNFGYAIIVNDYLTEFKLD